MKKLELLIIGAGPIGLACGIEAKKKGLDYLIIEKGVLTNSIFNYPVNMTFFSTSEKLEMADIPFMSISNKPTRPEALEYYRRIVKHYQLNINLYEKVNTLEKKEGGFVVHTSKGDYETEKLVLATGFYDLPNTMNVPGEDLSKVSHYYKEPWPYIGQKIIVVGGGNSAVDVALETWRKGAEVSMVVMKPEIDQTVKYWVLPDIENRIKEGSIKGYYNSSIKEIREKEVVLNTPEGEVTIENDFVLAMTGYKPNFELLDQLGVQLSLDEKRQPCFDDISQESNVPGLYLAGVVCGGLNTREFFIENTISHAKAIVKDIVNKKAILAKD
ncbi:YpdA family putative bacillithiol disulfide reductase [Cyclobacterium marinum]|uniref:FAD-dependent pyridine nucleotide-disulfide oxidoreductase n=1 Tax=Cyclobacterium marinum (strain ATCC 25205 / DSM 745 / LMG 13164 / NCIMB 1802) TaxID=880070 RepID=G0J2A5_CYCMS|nr:YpdA family putative bacillithiol disulfide reductase [Cyclobacterium marinum]AEL25179.1 FAD-dependent pyridine nucleotide-disulfide oxidoreductase [Cyclobacterium marinum DSM 745]MBI0400750.1 YpdA family putative bacillithiol disulfide reductase [Cyclobacterium marinum]